MKHCILVIWNTGRDAQIVLEDFGAKIFDSPNDAEDWADNNLKKIEFPSWEIITLEDE